MKRRWIIYAIAAYAAVELIIAIASLPRIIRGLTERLAPVETPTFITPWTAPPTIAPLPCDRYVNPADCPTASP